MTKKRNAINGRKADTPAPAQGIDPVEKPPRERTPQEAEAVRQFKERRGFRLRPPRFKVNLEGQTIKVENEHPDGAVWTVALCETFGVSEAVLGRRLMAQLLGATNTTGKVEVEDHVNAALAAVHGIAPNDAVEGMLAAQMVATHHAAMSMLEQAGQYPGTKWAETYTNSATKMLRTFTTQVEALKRYRAKGEQRYVVQHVHVTADQAAVQVNGTGHAAPLQAGEAGGILISGEQPHALDNQPPHLAALLCPDAQGDALPVPRGQG